MAIYSKYPALGGGAVPNPLLIAPGTAMAPSLAFNDHPGTGLFEPAANELGIAINSTLAAFFTANSLSGYTLAMPGQLSGIVIGPGASGTVPSYALTVTVGSDDYQAGFSAAAPQSVGGPVMSLYAPSGTLESPVASQVGELLGSFAWHGWNGTAVAFSGAVGARSTQLWSSGNQGTQLYFQVTPNGASVVFDALTIDQDGALQYKQLSSIASPTSGTDKLYFKSDDVLYQKTSAGVETAVGKKQFAVGTTQTTFSSLTSPSTFTAFSTSPSITFTALVSGNYDICLPQIGIGASALNADVNVALIPTAGSPTWVSGGEDYNSCLGAGLVQNYTLNGTWTLVAGTSYTFQVQAKANAGNLALYAQNTANGLNITARQL